MPGPSGAPWPASACPAASACAAPAPAGGMLAPGSRWQHERRLFQGHLYLQVFDTLADLQGRGAEPLSITTMWQLSRNMHTLLM
jgi:hypothetical protein